MRHPNHIALSLALLGLLWLPACQGGGMATASSPAPESPVSTQMPEKPLACPPTPPDMLGPFYEPGAPVRDAVGEGYTLSGVVRSALDCGPIAGAQVEIWMAGPDGQYGDDYRATLFSDEKGAYQFESHFPPPYSGRPSHHHLQVSAPGFETLVAQHYPVEGQTQAAYDLVLSPEP